MRIGSVDITYPRALAAALLLVTVVAGGYAASTSATAFGSYNPDWDGSRDLRLLANTHADTTVVRDTAAYPSTPSANATAVVLSPDTPYTARDIDRIRQFVVEGGTLLVAGDFGAHANRLLDALNTTIRIDGRLVRDERYYYRGPALPIARNVTAGLDVDQLTLNYGSVLRIDGNASVLASTSGYAYLDANRNGELDETETLGTYPVAATEPVGAGRVVVVSDPSVFINSMLSRPDNRAFARSLLSPADRVLFDYSHTADVPPLVAFVLVLRDSALLQLVVGSLVLLAGGLLARDTDSTRDSVDDVTLSADEIESVLADAHPSWSRERIERVARSIRRSKEPGKDG